MSEIDPSLAARRVAVRNPRGRANVPTTPGERALAELKEQTEVGEVLLRSLTRDETHAYVQHRLRTAGGSAELFEADALDALFVITRGVPREINRVCDLALLLGYADEAKSIDASRIEAVARELVDVTAD